MISPRHPKHTLKGLTRQSIIDNQSQLHITMKNLHTTFGFIIEKKLYDREAACINKSAEKTCIN